MTTIFTTAATTLIGGGWLILAAANPYNVRGQLDAETVLMMSVMAVGTAAAAVVCGSEARKLRGGDGTPPQPNA